MPMRLEKISGPKYIDENGQEKYVDLTVVPSNRQGYAYENVDNFARVFFKDRVASYSPILMETDSGEISWQLLGVSYRDEHGNEEWIEKVRDDSIAETYFNTVMYRESLTGVDDEFIVEPGTLKHNIIINQLPEYKGTLQGEDIVLAFEGRLDFPKSLRVFADGEEKTTHFRTGGSIDIKDDEGNLVFRLPSPFSVDSTEGNEQPCYYNVYLDDNFILFLVEVPYGYLTDPSITYPVKVDPTFIAWFSEEAGVPEHTSTNRYLMYNPHPTTLARGEVHVVSIGTANIDYGQSQDLITTRKVNFEEGILDTPVSRWREQNLRLSTLYSRATYGVASYYARSSPSSWTNLDYYIFQLSGWPSLQSVQKTYLPLPTNAYNRHNAMVHPLDYHCCVGSTSSYGSSIGLFYQSTMLQTLSTANVSITTISKDGYFYCNVSTANGTKPMLVKINLDGSSSSWTEYQVVSNADFTANIQSVWDKDHKCLGMADRLLVVNAGGVIGSTVWTQLPSQARDFHPTKNIILMSHHIARYDPETGELYDVQQHGRNFAFNRTLFSPDGSAVVTLRGGSPTSLVEVYSVKEEELVITVDNQEVTGKRAYLGILAQNEYSKVYTVRVYNELLTHVKDVYISLDPSVYPEGIFHDNIQLSKTSEPFQPEDSLLFPQTLAPKEYVEFYVRVLPDSKTQVPVRQIPLIATADLHIG